jgi:hypothetical protein
MAKTVMIEKLPLDTQRVLEELLTAGEPVVLSRAGRLLGGMIGYGGEEGLEALTPEEEADLRAAIAQGEADLAAGRCMTLDEFKTRNATPLQDKTP